jgi:hypothetical protein
MDEIDLQAGVAKALDALFADRLALLCGAGLSMAAPSSLPSAAALAWKAKQKYDATYGADRDPLPDSIDDQAEFFFQRGELASVYLRTYVDHDAFAAEPNSGHFAAADLLLTGAITTAVSTNVDTLIETAGNMLFGQVGAGVSRARVAALPGEVAPLLKIHGCWSDPPGTVWAAGQVAADPIKTRIEESAQWLSNRLLDRDLVIIGYWTDWDYLNQVLDMSLGTVNPSRVIVVDPCETASFSAKAPALFALGQRASQEFCHLRSSGDAFLDRLRVDFSRSFIRRVLRAGAASYAAHAGGDPDNSWLEPVSADAEVLWRIRRDLEGRNPNEPAKARTPIEEPLLGMTLLQLRAQGAVADGSYWNLGGRRVRVLRTANRPLHEVEAAFARETAPVVAPEYVIAVGAEALPLPPSIARGGGSGSIARGATGRWLSRTDAVAELGL